MIALSSVSPIYFCYSYSTLIITLVTHYPVPLKVLLKWCFSSNPGHALVARVLKDHPGGIVSPLKNKGVEKDKGKGKGKY